MKLSILILFIMAACLSSCNSSKKTPTLVDLTPRLEVSAKSQINPVPLHLDIKQVLANRHYSLTKNELISAPVIEGTRLYSLDNKAKVSLFNLDTKCTIWSRDIRGDKNNYTGGGIVFYQNKLYITYGSRYLVILDAVNGNEIVRKEMPDIVRVKPVFMNSNKLALQTISNQLLVLNLDNFDIIWQHELAAEGLSSSYHPEPILKKDKLIVSYNSGYIIAFNVEDGKILWGYDLSDGEMTGVGLGVIDNASVCCDPVSDSQYLYVASAAGKLVKIRIEDGKLIWKIQAYDVQSLALSGDSLFLTNNAAQVAVVKTNDGSVAFTGTLSPEKLKKLPIDSFLPPIITQEGSNWVLNVISRKGFLYKFISRNNIIDPKPLVEKIVKNIQFYNNSYPESYFTTNNNLILINKEAKGR